MAHSTSLGLRLADGIIGLEASSKGRLNHGFGQLFKHAEKLDSSSDASLLARIIVMFTRGIRRFATTARQAAESLAQMDSTNPYGINVSKAQGIVNGFCGGKRVQVQLEAPEFPL